MNAAYLFVIVIFSSVLLHGEKLKQAQLGGHSVLLPPSLPHCRDRGKAALQQLGVGSTHRVRTREDEGGQGGTRGDEGTTRDDEGGTRGGRGTGGEGGTRGGRGRTRRDEGGQGGTREDGEG